MSVQILCLDLNEIVLFCFLLSLLLSCKCSLYCLDINSYRCVYICAKSVQSRPTLRDPVDHSPRGSSVLGIFQAITIEYYMPYSRGSSQPRDQTCVSCICRGILLPLSHLGSPIRIYQPSNLKLPVRPSPSSSPLGKHKAVPCLCTLNFLCESLGKLRFSIWLNYLGTSLSCLWLSWKLTDSG